MNVLSFDYYQNFNLSVCKDLSKGYFAFTQKKGQAGADSLLVESVKTLQKLPQICITAKMVRQVLTRWWLSL